MKSVSSALPPAQAAIVRIIGAIPRGCVTSYGEVAERAGLPRRARLVGRVLREANPAWQLPWQRVLHADGSIAVAAGSRGWHEQCRRLRSEGVIVVNGRVDMARFGWQRNLDAQLWGTP